MGEDRRRREFYQQHPEQRLGDAPVDAEYHEKMVAIVRALDETFNGQVGGPGRKTGFVPDGVPVRGSHRTLQLYEQRSRSAGHRRHDEGDDRPVRGTA
jgi:hypothetical protein